MATKRTVVAATEDKDSHESNTNKMCRLCLKPASTETLVDIFDSSTETSLTIRIMACAGLEVMPCTQIPASTSEFFFVFNRSECHFYRCPHKMHCRKKCAWIVGCNWRNHSCFGTKVRIAMQNCGDTFAWSMQAKVSCLKLATRKKKGISNNCIPSEPRIWRFWWWVRGRIHRIE